MATYFLILTQHGSQTLAAAQAGTGTVQISHLVIGDANGQPYLPQSRPDATALVNERARVAVQSVAVVGDTVEVVATVDSTIGGFNLHEIGLTDANGQLLYLGNYHGGYKPELTEGAGGDLELVLVLATNGLGPVVVELDPTVVTANRQWVLDRFVRIPTFDAHVAQNDLEHANLLLIIQQLNQMLAQTQEDLMDTQTIQQIQQTLILMQERLTVLEQGRLEDVKVGDVFITTNEFADSNAVAAFKGYASTWQRFAQGRALVGAGTTVDARGETITVAAGQQFGSSQIIQQANQVGDHSHILGASSTNSNDGGTTYLDLIKVGTDEGYSLQGTETIPDTYQVKSSGTAEPMNVCQPSLGTYLWLRLS